ncbi:hypothetical protein M407DRAFT_20816 [Tulasnella calospora MUT 4182]|uniref:Enoyl reductase (ER) domain-containing protein n=1 Tax=Tulasnella calospora MUT 4182 TaxID=1051891 RepID=A0A0C3L8J6_9AGAM|nr:hypothetical protein M407DRAFT_20816 [Tulasnella calospora MUT 4182]
MSLTPNPTIIFVSATQGIPVPGQNLVYRQDITIDVDNEPLNGGILTKSVALGIDPWLRSRMVYEYKPNTPVLGYGIGVVLRSENPKFQVGDYVQARSHPFAHYAVLSEEAGTIRALKNDAGLPWTAYLGVLGLAGETAWVGYKAYAEATKGETIYISTGAGAVGSAVCQVAKAEGLRVIASAGSDTKVEFLKEIGVDVAFNYKKQDVGTVLKESGGIDIYWDNVGGKTLETVMGCMNRYGRIVVCGFASEYNLPPAEWHGNKSFFFALVKNLTINGFIIPDTIAKFGDFDFEAEVTKMVKEGRMKAREEPSDKLEDAMKMLGDCLIGANEGKGTNAKELDGQGITVLLNDAILADV